MIDHKLERIKKALKSEDGRVLVEYISTKMMDYSEPDTSKTYSEIGMEYAVCYNVNKKLKEMLRFFDSQL